MNNKKTIGVNFFHRHPGMEKALGVDNGHTIIDIDDYRAIKNYFETNPEALLKLKFDKEITGDVREFTDAEIDCLTFFDIEKHVRALDTNKNYVEIIEKQSLQDGRKLYLELTVTEPKLTQYLFGWLYGKNKETGKQIQLFGCRLETIHFNTPGIEELKRQVVNFINKL